MALSKAKRWLTPENLTLLEGWARDGLTNLEMAKKMRISESTFYEWMNSHPKFSEAIKKGKEVIDYEVEAQVLKSIKGFVETYDQQTVTKDGDVVGFKESRYIPPNMTAAIFWLKNRRPEKYNRKQVAEELEEDEGVIIVNDLPKEK
ncbi:MAG TPA: transposase [Firmicutes bacterium]|nr:transposase [Bacillota bacterium]